MASHSIVSLTQAVSDVISRCSDINGRSVHTLHRCGEATKGLSFPILLGEVELCTTSGFNALTFVIHRRPTGNPWRELLEFSEVGLCKANTQERTKPNITKVNRHLREVQQRLMMPPHLAIIRQNNAKLHGTISRGPHHNLCGSCAVVCHEKAEHLTRHNCVCALALGQMVLSRCAAPDPQVPTQCGQHRGDCSDCAYHMS
eukprot:5981632-Amphidinium_carterae.1